MGLLPPGDSQVLLALLMALKLGAGACLVLAHQRFLRFKRFIALLPTSLLCNLLVAFLHGLVPIVMVAILDNIAALIVAIIAIVWGVVLLVGSISSLVSSVRSAARRA